MKCFYTKSIGLIAGLIMLFSGLNITLGADEESGRKFHLTFLPNYHNNKWQGSQFLSRGDSLYIIVIADTEPTNGTITYSDGDGVKYFHSFTISNPDLPHIFSLAFNEFELVGFNNSGRIQYNTDNENVSLKSFYVETDKPVIVMGHNQAVTTSESFNVLPIELLAEDYIVMAYNSNGFGGTPEQDGAEGATPSQFAIVATENNTEVDIFPSAPTFTNRLLPQRITLNRNEVYLVQAYCFGEHQFADLTGTQIKATKPVAIFAGHQRTRVPYNLPQISASRDILLEQIPPIKFWNMSFPVIPLPDPVAFFDSRNFKDKLRVLAAFDGTELLVGDQTIAMLDKGEYYETDILEPFMLEATAPVLPMIYRRTAQLWSGGNSIGDPLMQIVPSIDQFSNRQKFYSLDVRQPTNTIPRTHIRVYTEHFAVVISPNDNFGDITMNGTAIDPTFFDQISNSDLSYAILKVNEGTNDLLSKAKVGLFVCGYGFANSYGYYTGTLRSREDWEPPLLQSSSDCFEIEGIVKDQAVKEVRIQEGTEENVSINVDSFTQGDSIVTFTARLVNPYLDGFFKLVAMDMVLQQFRRDMAIPGFTIAVNGTSYSADTIEIQRSLRSNIEYCMDYTIYNYGVFPQEVYLKPFISADFNTDFTPVTLQPGQSYKFEVCFSSKEDVEVSESLVLFNNCIERNFATMSFESKDDQYEPIILATTDPCNKFVNLKISDDDDWEWGLMKVVFDDVENLEIEVTIPGVYSQELVARVVDPFKDAYFMLTVTDSSGKISTYEAIIPGFTLEFEELTLSGSSEKYDEYEFPNTVIGGLNCQTFKIKNYGRFEIDIKDMYMLNNILFTVPQAQLPLVIQPGESRDLTICYRPYTADEEYDYDTLKLTYNCIDRFVPVSSLALSIELSEDSRCNVPLSIKATSVPNTVYLSGSSPNPTQSIARIEFGLPETSYVEIKVHGNVGKELLNLVNQELKAGHYEMEIDLSNLPSGMYLYTLHTDKIILAKTLIVNR